MPSETEISFYGGLVWYLEARNWAFEKMQNCPVGSQPFDIRIYHSLYFINLLSVIDHVRDHLRNDRPAQSAFVRRVEGGIQNFPYVRELRNSIVHRGLDPTMEGHAYDSKVYVLCPSTVQDQRRINSYNAPLKYLVQLARHCDSIVNPAVIHVLKQLNLFDADTHRRNADDIKAQIRNSAAMPDWAKELSLKALEEFDYFPSAAGMSAARFCKLKELLDSKAA